MNNNDVIKILSSKPVSAKVFIPFFNDKDLYDNFVVELLELIESYFYPIKYGLSIASIFDILEHDENLCEYLYKKRFIVLEEDFKILVSKYLFKDNNLETECVILEISKNLTESEITDLIQKQITIITDKINLLDTEKERITIQRSS